MKKKFIISEEKLFSMFTPGIVSENMKWCIKNNIIRLTDFATKFGGPIHFDFRIDQACTGLAVCGVGERMAEHFLDIEKKMDIKFDSMLCSLYGGIFSGVATAAFLKLKYNRDIKIAMSRRTYIQKSGAEAGTEEFLSSSHPLKHKMLVGELGDNVLLHDEMTNSGDTLRDLQLISELLGKRPKASMIIADRILDPLPKNVHVRLLDGVPCHSIITHYEIEEWCEQNKLVWEYLYEDPDKDQNKIK